MLATNADTIPSGTVPVLQQKVIMQSALSLDCKKIRSSPFLANQRYLFLKFHYFVEKSTFQGNIL